MTRGLRLVGAAFVVALALVPGSAEAQQIFACVNNSSGTIHVVAPNVACQSNEVLLNWNVAGPQGPAGPIGSVGPAGPQGPAGPGGALAGADYQCAPQGVQIPNIPILFQPSGVAFGSAISTMGTPPFSSFVLQPGIYQIHLSGGIPGFHSGRPPHSATLLR
jgi:hypothetical protein